MTFLVAALVQTRPWESAVDRAHRLCNQCGLSADETDGLVDTMRDMDRALALELFYATFDEPENAEPCEPCAYAVLDAAEVR